MMDTEICPPECLGAGIDNLLADSERSSTKGEHRLGAEQAEAALTADGANPAQQAKARQLLTLHRLRLGDYQASVKHGLLALEYFEATGDLLAQSTVHCTLALAFTDTALNETAVRHVLGALEAARACGNPTAEFWALSRFSLVHGAMGDGQRSIDLGRQALAVAQRLEDAETSFVAVNNLGDTYLVIARELLAGGEDATPAFTTGLALMREAVALAEAQGNPFNETLARTNLVSFLVGLRQHDEAREQGRRGKALSRTHGYRSLEIDIDAQLAELAREAGHVDVAAAMMEDQLANPDVCGEPKLLAKLHRALFEIYKADGRFDLALAHYEKLHAVTLLMTVQTAGLQSQMLINTIEIEQARHEMEKSRLQLRVEKIRAEELNDQAHTDPLTQLSNRRALDRELPWMIARAQRRNRPLCAAMIDLDNFKLVNDDHGHTTGDEVLTVVAGMLRTITRGTDLAVRVGGEEFLLIFAETSEREAAIACERLLASVRGYDWEAVAPGLRCTVSAGLAQLERDGSIPDWLARADRALYDAKRAGRDQIVIARAMGGTEKP
ncbi:GGDEF domain-containing protein [Cryobacterium sp. CG_9.6]|uniref:GGDEF domain-containing protein n=1 Tax=Cryobacterium sp. CG_9.6 TaxID=2760710 RepID=UPI002474D8F1|nr:GGDEF domain-containing protein [Cryobacterium sp. CG_9.6]MDH6237711.1 diguanylate cyclase (GGDEF)-like protein [Cryobacterium sp. CG_9.6]